MFDEEISEAEFEAIRDSYPEINDLVWIRLASNPAFGESGGEAAQPQDAGAPADDALLGEWYNYLGPGHSDSPPLLILHDDGTFEFMEEGYALRRRRGALISGTYQVVDGVVECTALEESGEDTPRSYMSNLRFTIKEDGTLEYRGALAGRTTVQVVFERERPDE